MGEAWLELDEPDQFLAPPEGASREEQFAKALEFAKLYLVFVTDERARRLLEQWDAAYTHKRVSVNATIAEYAANEAMRTFIQAIKDQIKFAQTDNR